MSSSTATPVDKEPIGITAPHGTIYGDAQANQHFWIHPELLGPFPWIIEPPLTGLPVESLPPLDMNGVWIDNIND
jgi:hypothetical protein